MTDNPTTVRARIKLWSALETTSGILLLVAAAVALTWANSPWSESYAALGALRVGPAALHLDLSLATWAADGLLAIFFFVVGVELKQELVTGGLRDPKRAGVPILAAIGGMILPAVIFLVVVTLAGDGGARHGWAIPTATDIAFALGVLAVFGRGLPVALRLFLLTLAVVDDLLAIIVIAAFYTADLQIGYLLGALASAALFAAAVRVLGVRSLLLPVLAIITWVLMHESGVHATVAGVVLGLSVPARPVLREKIARTAYFEHKVRPFSTVVALPLFAFFSAGVVLSEGGGLAGALSHPVALAVGAGLLIGKLVGVLGVTALVTKVSPLRLPPSIGLRDLLPIGLLTGIGFTVSLLIAELSFADPDRTAAGKIAILAASGIAAIAGAVMLRWDARRARDADMNRDGLPDEDQVEESLGGSPSEQI
ncbi:MAG: Na+/H+ antiporter NhaA [Actinomycetota bacterium]|nr:Na+/H+ antiporter NhaA [Actinomycetota bacterium]